jgi:hypothetical protein
MSFEPPDEFPKLGIPISRLNGIIEDLGGAAKAGALSCDDFFAKTIRPICKGNGLPLAQHIALKDESTRTTKARCSPADTLVIQSSGHGFIDTFAALVLHMGREELSAEASQARDAQVRASAAPLPWSPLKRLTLAPLFSISGGSSARAALVDRLYVQLRRCAFKRLHLVAAASA